MVPQNSGKKVIGQIVRQFEDFEGKITDMATDSHWGTVIITVENETGEKREFILNPTIPNVKLPKDAKPDSVAPEWVDPLKLRQERSISLKDLFGVISFDNGAGKFSKSMAIKSINDFSRFIGSSVKVTDNDIILVTEVNEPKIKLLCVSPT